MALTTTQIESERKLVIFEARHYEITLHQLFINEDELADWASHRHKGWNKTDITFKTIGLLNASDLEKFSKEVDEALQIAKEWDKEVKENANV